MYDIYWLGLTFGLFIIGFAYIATCERI